MRMPRRSASGHKRHRKSGQIVGVDDVGLFGVEDFTEAAGRLAIPDVAQMPSQPLQRRWLPVAAERPVVIVDRQPVDADALELVDDGVRAVVQANRRDLVAASRQRFRQQGNRDFSPPDDLGGIQRIDEKYFQRSPRSFQ